MSDDRPIDLAIAKLVDAARRHRSLTLRSGLEMCRFCNSTWPCPEAIALVEYDEALDGSTG